MTKKPNSIDIIVSCRLKEARINRGLSQTDAASQLNLTYQQLQKYETGQNRVTAGRLWQFSVIYRIPIQCFFDGCERINVLHV